MTAMNALVHLPDETTPLQRAIQREIATQNDQGAEAIHLAGVLSELREAMQYDIATNPSAVGPLARALWALAQWREAERRWKNAEIQSAVARGRLAYEAALVLGVCVECSATSTAKDGYCDDCREVEVPF